MIFSHVPFGAWCLIVGVIAIAIAILPLVSPQKAAEAMKRFPRSIAAGVVLSTLAFAWAAAIVLVAPLDFIAPWRLWIAGALIVSAPLSWFWMSPLLACRALGGLLVLLPAPVLLASRMVDSQWRLVMVVLMYVCAVCGMDMIMAPYHLRDALAWIASTPSRVRAAGAALIAVGIASIALPFLV